MREALITAIRTRIQEMLDNGDGAAVLDARAVDEAVDLLCSAPGQTPDPADMHLVGWLHWHRHLAGAEDQVDQPAAAAMFAQIVAAYPDAVPTSLRDSLRPASQDVPWWYDYIGAYVLAIAGEPHELVNPAGRLVDTLLSYTPDNRPDRLQLRQFRANLRYAQARRARDPEQLAEVIEEFRTMVAELAITTIAGFTARVGLGTALRYRHELTSDATGLEEALAIAREVYRAIPRADDRTFAMVSVNLGVALLAHFQATDDLDALDEGIATLARAGAAIPAEAPFQAHIKKQMSALSDAYATALLSADRPDLDFASANRRDMLYIIAVANLTDFSRTGELPLVDASIAAFRRLLRLPDAQTGRANLLEGLTTALRARYHHTNGEADAEQLVEVLEVHAAHIGTAPEDRRRLTNQAGILWQNRYQRSGDLRHLDRAIGCFRSASAGGEQDSIWASYLSNLGNALRLRYDASNDIELLREAVAAGRRAGTLPAEAGARTRLLASLAGSLLQLHDREPDPRLLDEALEAAEAAVAAAPDEAERGAALSVLAVVHHTHHRTDDRSGGARLDQVIESTRAAVAMLPIDHPGWAAVQTNLVVLLEERFGSIGEPTHLDEAIRHGEEALAAAPPGMVNRMQIRTALAHALFLRYQHFQDPIALDHAAAVCARTDDEYAQLDPEKLAETSLILVRHAEIHNDEPMLDKTLDLARRAVRQAGDDKRQVIGSILGVQLTTRYRRSGDLAALDESITLGRSLLAAATPRRRAEFCADLSAALLYRYEHTGDRADLTEATQLATEGTDDPNPVMAAHCLLALGNARNSEFANTEQDEPLDAAIAAFTEATRLLPERHSTRPNVQANLAASRYAKAARTRDRALLERALADVGAALAARTIEQSRRARWLGQSFAMLRTRAHWTGTTEDLDTAIATGRHAVAAADTAAIDLARTCTLLAETLTERQELDPSQDLTDEILGCWRNAAQAPGSPPVDRCLAAAHAGQLAAEAGQWSAALDDYRRAIDLLPRVASRRLDQPDKELFLARLQGIVSNAAACAINAKDPLLALELLEQGRGLVIGEILDNRSDLSDLRRAHPDLAERFEQLRNTLDDYSARSIDLVGSDTLHRSDAEWEELLSTIRARPGMRRFLAPPTVHDLARAAVGHPIVVVNMSVHRCDAFVLTDDTLRIVELPDLTLSDATAAVRVCLAAFDPTADPQHRQEARVRLSSVLGWLWDVLVGPVLWVAAARRTPAPGSPWPRVWWVPTGPLTLLPLHAAGHHLDDSAVPLPTALDRIVSSYAPTIRALIEAQHRRGTSGADGSLVVAVSDQPSADLPAARAEAARIAAHLRPQPALLSESAATPDAVLAALRTAAYVHFSCHAASDLEQPHRSSLRLWGGSLTASEVARQRTVGGRLAYLSACETARGGPTLADEAMHVSTAFFLAGYRHVIGSLWQVEDTVAHDVAVAVYDAIRDPSGAEMNVDDVAVALHEAVRAARDAHAGRSPARWAALVHIGP